jgi:tetratricopeptide (TPR) repeat protein
MTGRVKWLGLMTLGVVAAAVCASWLYQEWTAAALLDSGKDAANRGDFVAAGRDFGAVLRRWPDHDEALFGLGVCEQSSGRPDAAVEAWERIGPASSYAPVAAARIAPIALEHGQFARAEDLLWNAVRASGPHVAEAREMLVRVLRFEDRRDEARGVLRQELKKAPDTLRVLRALWMLDVEAVALERTLAMFKKATLDVPDDDRVWLGLANLARRAGRLDEAAERLRRCRNARPEDPAVWRSWLAWARAVDSVEEARLALQHLPAKGFTEGEVQELRAWFARSADDRQGERRGLERLMVCEPSFPGALERLAELDALDGATDQVAELRRKKAELDAARERYHQLFEAGADRLATLTLEMAKLAETLGRSIEAEGWWTMRLRAHPGDDEARAALNRLERSQPSWKSGATLADLLADLTPSRLAKRSPASLGSHEAQVRPVFSDDAGRAGLNFTFDHDRSPQCHLPETMSGGLGLLDYDGDGWLDVYCVQGGPLSPSPDRPSPGDRLFHNRGDGTFEDASESSGIAAMPRGYGHGVAVGDYDNDGRPDLFVTRLGSYALYRNQGNGTFQDRTEAAGFDGRRGWPTSAAFADLDGDGDLDLYVCHYVRWDPDHATRCHDRESKKPSYCEPRVFESEPDRLFRNDGGRFVDVSEEAGIIDHEGRGLGVVAVDLDGDKLVDLFVANDTTANFAFMNQGGLKFRESGLESGLAANAASGFLAGMGVACGDSDGDGLPDLAVTNFYDESTTLYRNLGRGLFADHSAAAGTALPSRYLLGFGIAFLDFNNDGRLDLVMANGHVNDSRPLYPYAMPTLLLAGSPSGRFADVTLDAGPPLTTPRLGRGLAVGDLDNDGKVDLLMVSQGEPLIYFHNQTKAGHYLALRLEGSRSSRDAAGARIVVKSGGVRHSTWRFGGGSYLSASDSQLHFGLGDQDRVESIDVYWPSGQISHFENLRADAAYLLREGLKAPEPLVGFTLTRSWK